jgi:hypothetical protein
MYDFRGDGLSLTHFGVVVSPRKYRSNPVPEPSAVAQVWARRRCGSGAGAGGLAVCTRLRNATARQACGHRRDLNANIIPALNPNGFRSLLSEFVKILRSFPIAGRYGLLPCAAPQVRSQRWPRCKPVIVLARIRELNLHSGCRKKSILSSLVW